MGHGKRDLHIGESAGDIAFPGEGVVDPGHAEGEHPAAGSDDPAPRPLRGRIAEPPQGGGDLRGHHGFQVFGTEVGSQGIFTDPGDLLPGTFGQEAGGPQFGSDQHGVGGGQFQSQMLVDGNTVVIVPPEEEKEKGEAADQRKEVAAGPQQTHFPSPFVPPFPCPVPAQENEEEQQGNEPEKGVKREQAKGVVLQPANDQVDAPGIDDFCQLRKR